MQRLTQLQFLLQLWAACWIIQLSGFSCSASVLLPETDDLSPRRSRPSQVHLGAAAAEAVADIASRRTLGVDRRPDSESQGNETEIFPTCMMACEVCFRDFRQVCLAYCVRGCGEYCEERLPDEECKEEGADTMSSVEGSSTRWYAQISFATGLLDSSARLCRASGINGCPERMRRRAISDTSPVYDPYHYRPEGESQNAVPTEETSQHGANEADNAGAVARRNAQENFGLRGSPLRFRHMVPV
mmetsp:Transcript_20036/g.46075  ORF Transcript_20036/g.46075 Transcript_20036/m.46075 type:complete len:244 (-) Transcript_20036:41-772(-)